MQDAVVLGTREEADHLAAEDGGGPEILVEPRGEDDVMRLEQGALALQSLVEAAQGRATVARDEGGGTEPASLISAVLVERQTDQSLDAGEIDAARLLRVFRVQREALGLCGHGAPCRDGGSLHDRVGNIVMVGDEPL